MSKIKKAPYTRVRGQTSRVDIVRGSNTVRTYQSGSQTSESVNNQSYPSLERFYVGRQCRDVVTPEWQTLKQNGILVNNPVHMQDGEFSYKPFDGVWLTHSNTSGYKYEERLGNWVMPSTSANFLPLDPIAIDVLKSNAINETFNRAHQRSVMGMVDIAEIDKTISMLKTQAGRLNSVLSKSIVADKKLAGNKFVSGNGTLYQFYKPRTVHGHAADAAGLWLEVQYGIVPLMLSISGLVDSLCKMHGWESSNDDLEQTYRSKDEWVDFIETFNEIPQPAMYGGTLLHRYRHTLSYHYKVRAGLRSRYRPGLKAMLGLETRDVITSAHELIKYSFVLDWVFNLGQFLEAAVPVKDFTQTASWVTILLEEFETFDYTHVGNTSSDGTWTAWRASFDTSMRYKRREYIREVNIQPQLPQLDLRFRSFKHAISAASLVLSRSKDKAIARI